MKLQTYTIARADTGAVLQYAVVTVYQSNGSTLATIYDGAGAALGNPLTADINGAISFTALNGTYILRARSADGTLTIPDITVQIFDLDALATAIAAGSLAGVIGVKFATRAAMNADLAHAADMIALVYADSTALNNDLYYKIGASGSGSWSAPLGLMAGLSQTYANLAAAWAEGTLPGGGGTKSAKEYATDLNAIVSTIGDEVGAIHRFKWKTAILAYFDPLFAALPGIFRPVAGILMPSAKTFIDDDTSTPLVSRIPGTLFTEQAAVHRFKWGSRMLAYFDPLFTAAPGALRIPAGAVLPAASTYLDDNLTTLLLDRLGASGGASSDDIVVWGHSFTTQNDGGTTYPQRIATALGVAVTNYGIGGQTSTQIACRAGALCARLSVTGDQIPTSGAVTVTYLSSLLLSTPATLSFTRTITGYLGGVYGTLQCVESASGDSFDTYTFTRATSGTAVNIAAETPFIPDIWDKTKRVIFHLARNDIGDLAGLLARQDAMIAALGHDRYIIVGEWPGGTEPSGSTGYNNIVAWNRACAERYGKHFVDIHHYTVAHGLADLSLSPTSQDTTDIGNDVVPQTFRDPSDIHPSDYGLTIIANRGTERFTFLATGV